MNVALAQRQIALAGLALLAGILALAFSSEKSSGGQKLPDSIPAPGGGWYQAVATSSGPLSAVPPCSTPDGRPAPNTICWSKAAG